MKKVLSIVLVIALVLGMSAVTALAEGAPTTGGEVHGVITNDPEVEGHFTGYVTGAYDLEIDGQFTSGFVAQHATFNATVTGDFSGTITNGLYCLNGLDTMYAVITGTGASTTVRIQGVFLQSGIAGDFAGEIVLGDEPAPVTNISITTAGDATTVAAGSTLQCSATTTPSGYDIYWAVWTPASGGGRATIDQDGVLTALETGSITVIANTLDPALATQTKTLTVVDPQTEVTGAVDPTYMIIIPSAVDFGTLVKDGSIVSQDFDVEAQGVIIEDTASIVVSAAGPFKMLDQDGAGSVELPYTLSNNTAAIPAAGGTFATFSGNDTEEGSVSVDTDDITAAGSYQGTMVFTITYND